MKDEPLEIMENQILAEEPLSREPRIAPESLKSPQKQPLNQKLRTWFYKLKAPKPITYIILTATILIIYIGLLLMSQNNAKQQPKPSPSPSAEPTPLPSSNPSLNEMFQKVDEYNKNLDLFNSSNRKFEPPNVDLDINFSQKK